jgi:hypothetical protein
MERGADGASPLIAAAREGDAARVEALLKGGVDPQLTLPDGSTALDVATQHGHADVVHLLTQVETAGCWGPGCTLRRHDNAVADADADALPPSHAATTWSPSVQVVETGEHMLRDMHTAQVAAVVAHDGTHAQPSDGSDHAHAVPHLPPLDGTQLTATMADAVPFSTVYDLIPDVGDRDCILSTDGRRALSYSRLRTFIATAAFGAHPLLSSPSRSTQHRVVLGLPNSPEAAVAFLALSVRCTVAPLNVAVTAEEAAFELSNLPAAVVITLADSPSGATLRSVARAAGIPQFLLHPDPDTAGVFTLSPIGDGLTEKETPLPTGGGAVDGGGHDNSPAAPTPASGGAWLGRDDTCLLLHTSGTTLKPKLVPLTHRNLGTAALCIRSTLQLKHTDIGLNVMPLHHLHGIMVRTRCPVPSPRRTRTPPHHHDSHTRTHARR